MHSTKTTNVPKSVTLEEILKVVEKINSFPKGKWMLVSPDGRVWSDEDPQKLALSLALECYPFKV